jgi:hypothetical protein
LICYTDEAQVLRGCLEPTSNSEDEMKPSSAACRDACVPGRRGFALLGRRGLSRDTTTRHWQAGDGEPLTAQQRELGKR